VLIENKSALASGNRALRDGRYAEAIPLYASALLDMPELGKTLAFNLQWAHQRMAAMTAQANARCLGRITQQELTGLAAGSRPADGELISSILFPRAGHAESTLASDHVRVLQVIDGPDWLMQAITFVAGKQYAQVELARPTLMNFVFGVLYKQIWNARVVVCADDGNGANAGARLASIEKLRGTAWDQHVDGMAAMFDPVGEPRPARLGKAARQLVARLNSPLLMAFLHEVKRPRRDAPAPAREVACGGGWMPFSMRSAPAPRPSVFLAAHEWQYLPAVSLIEFGGIPVGVEAAIDGAPSALPVRLLAGLRQFSALNGMSAAHGLSLRDTTGAQPIAADMPPDAATGEAHCFGPSGLRLRRAWYASARLLRMHVDTGAVSEARVLRAYQYDAGMDGQLAMVAEAPLGLGGDTALDLALLNPYLPVLLLLSDGRGQLLDLALLPFPSLLPHGLHAVEAATLDGDAMAAAAVLAQRYLDEWQQAHSAGGAFALGEYLVDVHGAIGTERIFSTDLKEWLWTVFGTRVKLWRLAEKDEGDRNFWEQACRASHATGDAKRYAEQAARERAGLRLLAPATAIPTLRALSACRVDGRNVPFRRGEYLLVTGGQGAPRYHVRVPDFTLAPERALQTEGVVRHPTILVEKKSGAGLQEGAGAAVIVFVEAGTAQQPELIYPFALDGPMPFGYQAPVQFPSVVVFMSADWPSEAALTASLESLRSQSGVTLASVNLLPAGGADTHGLQRVLAAVFPDIGTLWERTPGETESAAVIRALGQRPEQAGGHVVMMGQATLLHDSRTLAVFAHLLAHPKVASVGCPLIGRAEPKPNAAYSVQFSGLAGQSQADSEPVLAPVNLHALFPRALVPVACNGSAFVMMLETQVRRCLKQRTAAASLEEVVRGWSANLSERQMLHLQATGLTVEALGTLPGHVPGPVACPANFGLHLHLLPA
jgi:hypothetical protein